MIFTELNFWAFFAIVSAAYVVLPHKAQNRMLLVASYFFYGSWDWRFLSLILLSTGVDYLVKKANTSFFVTLYTFSREKGGEQKLQR